MKKSGEAREQRQELESIAEKYSIFSKKIFPPPGRENGFPGKQNFMGTFLFPGTIATEFYQQDVKCYFCRDRIYIE